MNVYIYIRTTSAFLPNFPFFLLMFMNSTDLECVVISSAVMGLWPLSLRLNHVLFLITLVTLLQNVSLKTNDPS